LVLPDSAVFKNNEGDYVMVAGKDNHAESRPVQVGIRNGHSVQIVDGLKAGEPVITDGAYALPDKAAIKIESEKERPAAAKDKDDKEKD
jgi:membrane fusion protein (multidrug efflux system)